MVQATIDDALGLVVTHFKGVTDKDGEPYVMHCLRVMMGVTSDHARQVAVMHDLIEDTSVTIEELQAKGFDPEVLRALSLVTHVAPDSYADYVIRLKGNPIAREVKLSDLRDNSSMNRVLYRESHLDRDLKRIQRYILSYQFLTDRVDQQTYAKQMQVFEE